MLVRSLAIALSLAALLLATEHLFGARLPIYVVAPLAVAVGVAAASLLQGGANAASVLFGALGALAFAWFRRVDDVVALTALSALWLTPRALLARTRRDAIRAAVAAGVASVVAGYVLGTCRGASLTIEVAAAIFSSAAVGVALLLTSVDSPIAAALASAARELEGPVRAQLETARDRARQGDHVAGVPPVSRGAWRELLRLADARVALEKLGTDAHRDERAKLDEELRRAVETLSAAAPTPPSKSDAEPASAPAPAPAPTNEKPAPATPA